MDCDPFIISDTRTFYNVHSLMLKQRFFHKRVLCKEEGLRGKGGGRGEKECGFFYIFMENNQNL